MGWRVIGWGCQCGGDAHPRGGPDRAGGEAHPPAVDGEVVRVPLQEHRQLPEVCGGGRAKEGRVMPRGGQLGLYKALARVVLEVQGGGADRDLYQPPPSSGDPPARGLLKIGVKNTAGRNLYQSHTPPPGGGGRWAQREGGQGGGGER